MSTRIEVVARTPHDGVDVEHDRAVEPPSTFRLLLEGRATGELLTTLALRPWLRRLQKGDGHPVLLLPGFLASDLSTRPLRGFLRDLDYWAHRWNLGRNLGSSEMLEARMSELGPVSRPIVVYCRSGGRSALATGMMRRAGYQVEDIGPMSAW